MHHHHWGLAAALVAFLATPAVAGRRPPGDGGRRLKTKHLEINNNNRGCWYNLAVEK